MKLDTTTSESTTNPNGCDENHCLCPDGAENCILDNPPQSLAIAPQGDHWQVIPPPRPLTLEERLQRLIDLCDRSAKLADEIAASLNK
jgi:hypothetical protein